MRGIGPVVSRRRLNPIFASVVPADCVSCCDCVCPEDPDGPIRIASFYVDLQGRTATKESFPHVKHPGRFLGFEVIQILDWGDGRSYGCSPLICNQLDKDLGRDLNLNQCGQISDLDGLNRFLTFLAAHPEEAEPGPFAVAMHFWDESYDAEA